MYSEERELDVETESKMTHEEKGSNKGQPQAEAAVKDIESARGKEREDEELAAAGVSRSREVLEDDVLSWWNEALASQDSVLVTSQDSVLTVLELAGGEKQSLQTDDESRSGLGLTEQNQLRDELQYASEKNQGDQSHKGSKEQKTEGREGSETPTRDTIMKEGMNKETQETLEQTYGPPSKELLNPASYDWDTTNVTDSQLLSMLASKHCYQCTSTSTLDWTDYEEEEEERYNEEEYQQEMEQVVSASLHIPLYSPVRVRTVVQRGFKEEHTVPLSPLTMLSRRLAQRMKGSRSATISPPPTPDLSALEATWRQAAATQTSCTSSTATLRSPLLPPTRQQFSPRASTHFYTAPSSPILVTPVPHRRINEEQERKRREEEEEEAKQRAEEVRMRKLKKVLAKEERERQALARRRAEKEEKEEADKLEAEQWRNVQCSPCTKCKGKQAGKTKGKQKIKKKEVKDDKGEKKPVIRDIFFGCFKAPSCMA